MQKHTNKYLNFTKEEIIKYVEKFKLLIKANRFKISDINREKNIEFINKYHLNTKNQKSMLLEIEVEDFFKEIILGSSLKFSSQYSLSLKNLSHFFLLVKRHLFHKKVPLKGYKAYQRDTLSNY